MKEVCSRNGGTSMKNKHNISKNYNIELQMMKNNFKDFKTNLFYINKTTTNSNDYFNITLF